MKKSNKPNRKNYSSFNNIDARESDYLYITNSQIPNAGLGLYTAIPIAKNEIISLFRGEIISLDEANIRADKGHNKYFIEMLDGNIMDSMHVKCFAKYANDSKGLVKTEFKLNSIISLDDNNNICLIAKRDIQTGEEVFCSYGKKYWKAYEKELFSVQQS
jgi:uncharacterized protein